MSIYAKGSWSQRVPRRKLIDRDQHILSLSVGKRVLHIGATDAPFTFQKLQSGALLHTKLRRVTSALVGTDVDEDAIAIIGETTGLNDIIAVDCSADPLTTFGRFDVILCCDVIEHVGNAESLIKGFLPALAPNGSVVISTINATAIKPALRGLVGREAVHHDHVSYHSFATLGSLLSRTRLSVCDVRFFSYPAASRAGALIFGGLHRIAPAVADGILVVARPEEAA